MDAKKVEKKRKTVTFEPEPDVRDLIEMAESRGHGVKSKMINQAVRRLGLEIINQWDADWGPERQLVTEDEAAGRLGITVEELKKLRSDRQITHYVLSPRIIRYEKITLDKWIEEHPRPNSTAKPELETALNEAERAEPSPISKRRRKP